MMTEEEAKQKWCPIMGLAGAVMSAKGGTRNCMGSACMMWRLVPIGGSGLPIGFKTSAFSDGYCGLAGKP